MVVGGVGVVVEDAGVFALATAAAERHAVVFDVAVAVFVPDEVGLVFALVNVGVGARAAHQVVGRARAAYQPVGAFAAEQNILSGAAVEFVIARAAFQLVFAAAEQATRVVLGFGVAVERVVLGATLEFVVVAAADERVFAGAADQGVIAGIAQQPVIAGAAFDVVSTPTAVDGVAPRAAIQAVVVEAAFQGIRAFAAEDGAAGNTDEVGAQHGVGGHVLEVARCCQVVVRGVDGNPGREHGGTVFEPVVGEGPVFRLDRLVGDPFDVKISVCRSQQIAGADDGHRQEVLQGHQHAEVVAGGSGQFGRIGALEHAQAAAADQGSVCVASLQEVEVRVERFAVLHRRGVLLQRPGAEQGAAQCVQRGFERAVVLHRGGAQQPVGLAHREAGSQLGVEGKYGE